MTVMETPATASDVLARELRDAWFEYLESCRLAPPDLYEQVEPWAWSRMRQQIKAATARLEAA